MSLAEDTIKIKEVVIRRNKLSSELAGYKKTVVDSSVLAVYSNRSISDVLSDNTGIFIKSYGMGGTATPAFRGTDASHTLVDWNGINLNSPMLGQSDLSILPAGLIDDVEILFGGASMSLNAGGSGGTINLVTKPLWKKETTVSINAGTGSFGQYSGLIKVRTGNYKFQSVTKGYFENSENNFRYFNTDIGQEPVWQTRTNSQVRQQGFIQEFYLRNSNNMASARIWYQSADRNLPSSLLTSPNPGERQFDESMRTIFNYDTFKGNADLTFTGAWILSRLNYFNPVASIDSRNLSDVFTFKTGLENPLGHYAKLKIILDDQSTVINSNNYDQHKTRNTATISTSVERERNRFGMTILIREILDNSNLLIPDFSAGIRFRLTDDKAYYLKGNISRNSRIPTMNEMYWMPGGNPDLKNESDFIYEISYQMTRKIPGDLELKYDLTIFRYNMKDMIQWHPGEYSYWTADNIQSANSTGAESSVSLEYIHNRINTSLKAAYSFTRATEGGSEIRDEQLMYVPENKFNSTFRIGYKKIYFSWMTDFTGQRYTTVDNSKYLPAYFVNNLNTGVKFTMKNSSIDLNFNIDNLFNVNYQSIAYYPLPGRSFFMKILFQMTK
jgi:outer membrane cobalamin receptor